MLPRPAPEHAGHAGCVTCAERAPQFLLVFRGLVGLGLGGAPVAFALYLEFVPSRHRGALLVALQAFWTVGSIVEVRGRLVSAPPAWPRD